MSISDKGFEYQNLAIKELKRFTLFGFLGPVDYCLVAENYDKAANCWRSLKDKNKEKQARELVITYLTLGHDKYNCLEQYTKLIEITDSYEEKINLYKEMLNIYRDNGKFDQVEKVNTAIGDLYFENMEFNLALKFYNEIIEGPHYLNKYYEISIRNTCKIYLSQNKLSEVADLYQLLINNISGYYAIKTILCRLCLNDIVSAKRLLDDESKITVIEREFIEKIISSYEEHNFTTFMNHVHYYEHHAFTMDHSVVDLLLRLKRNLETHDDNDLL